MRLSEALRDVGLASHLGVNVEASDVWTTQMTLTSRGALFRQLEENPTFQADRVFSLSSILNLEQMTPASWGVEIPLSVSHVEADQDPQFLARSDVRAGRLENLRDTGSRRTRVDVSFRKRTPTANPVIGLLLDGLEIRAGYSSAASSTITAEGSSEAMDAHLGYGRAVGRRDFALIPGFLRPVVRWLLPRTWEEEILGARLRWTPERLSFGATYARADQRALRFDQIVEGAGDSLAQATLSPRESLEGAMEVVFRPFQTLTAQADLVSIRDILPAEEAVTDAEVQALLDAERSESFGFDFGWETNQLLRTRMNYEPRLGQWLRANLGWQSSYSSDRNAAFLDRSFERGDTVLALERSANGQRDFTGQFTPCSPRVARARPRGVGGSGGRILATPSPRGLGPDLPHLPGRHHVALQPRARKPRLPVPVRICGPARIPLPRSRHRNHADRPKRVDRTLRRAPPPRPSGCRELPPERGQHTRHEERPHAPARDVAGRVGHHDRSSVARGQSLLQRVTLSAGFQRIRQETGYGGVGQQRRFQQDERIPMDVAVVWGGGLSTAYRGSLVRGEGGDPTGDTERERENHILSISGTFRPPATWAERLERPLTTSALLQFTSDRNCRATAGGGECVPFLDELIRSLTVRLETTVVRTDLRLQLSYTDRRSFVGLRSGSTQFQFGLFGRFIIADDALLR